MGGGGDGVFLQFLFWFTFLLLHVVAFWRLAVHLYFIIIPSLTIVFIIDFVVVIHLEISLVIMLV
jgi:hypothetical protein